MPVIAVVNRKGGSGKSTLATHLAAYFAHNKLPALLGDADFQQSSHAWLRQRDKQRFALSADSRRIRANQGHSVAVDLALSTVEPPDVLYHGTALSSLASIQTSGLLPGNRHDVHLSADSTTARTVGSRHGKPVVLKVNAKKMRADGHLFRVSENGVWLALMVPPTYLEIWTESG